MDSDGDSNSSAFLTNSFILYMSSAVHQRRECFLVIRALQIEEGERLTKQTMSNKMKFNLGNFKWKNVNDYYN